jgi:hypothetical protein
MFSGCYTASGIESRGKENWLGVKNLRTQKMHVYLIHTGEMRNSAAE